MSNRLKRKKPCLCTRTDIGDISRLKWHGRCTLCNDTKELNDYPSAYKLSLKYDGVDWSAITEISSENEIVFICSCGNELFVTDEPVACVCGRIYRLPSGLTVNEDYLGKQDQLWKDLDNLENKENEN